MGSRRDSVKSHAARSDATARRQTTGDAPVWESASTVLLLGIRR
jgi:hypothetical protein